jgi:hypothetical protein
MGENSSNLVTLASSKTVMHIKYKGKNKAVSFKKREWKVSSRK